MLDIKAIKKAILDGPYPENVKEQVSALVNRIEKLEKENEDLIYENVKMKDYIKNYGITHGTIKK